MTVHPWAAAWGKAVPLADLQIERANQFAAFLERQAQRLAHNIRALRDDNGPECVLFDLAVERPQRTPIAIEAVEPVGVIFSEDHGPLLLSLRADFPDTMHQNLVPEGYPSLLCMDNRPWPEARLTWTPGEMLERIQLWFRRAARGELQDATQPVEPFFGGSSLQIVVPRAVLAMAAENRAELTGKLPSASNPQVMVTSLDVADIREASTFLSLVAYQVAPDMMSRMRFAPGNLASLVEFLHARGIDLVADLTSRIKAWAGTTNGAARSLAHQFGIILDLPIVNPANELVGGTQTVALLSPVTVGTVGEALGILERNISGTGSV
jgi:Prokaryotic E2 family A